MVELIDNELAFKMNSAQYESLTSKIAGSVFAATEGMAVPTVKCGTRNKWEGQSGFRHQIDVTVEGAKDIIMVECKFWKKACVKVEHLLTFVARINDLRPVSAKNIHAVMVTSHRFQRGCSKLAAYYKIDLLQIFDAGRFAFQYKGMRFVGVAAARINVVGLRPTLLKAHTAFNGEVRQRER